jgi:serine/threonine protein kinase
MVQTSVSTPQSKRNNSSDLAIHATHDANEIPYSQITVFTNEFAEVLGKGAFATVFKGVMYRQEVAVKVDHEVKDEKMRKFIKQQFVDEINTLYKYKHENLCMLLAHSIDGPTRCLVYEICHHGSIWDRLRNDQQPSLTWAQRLRLAFGSTKALVYLHTFKPPAVHRDIKSMNILITAEYEAKVSDFGTMREMAKAGAATMATTMPSVTSMETRQVIGTQHYMPPE